MANPQRSGLRRDTSEWACDLLQLERAVFFMADLMRGTPRGRYATTNQGVSNSLLGLEPAVRLRAYK